MAKRATVEDLAKAAGVSVATVDRVLNRRLPVRPATAERVHEAALRIGFHASGLIGQRIREEWPAVRLGVLLLETSPQFYGAFAREIETAAAELTGYRCTVLTELVSSQAPGATAAKVRSLGARTHALAVVAPEHPALTEAVRELKERGVPVFSLLSDFAAGLRGGYLGVHNTKAGRTAAWMIARCARRPGSVALFVGSHRFHGHELRETGFRTFFREEAPAFGVLDTVVNLETQELTHASIVDLARREPGLAGVYVAGGGAEGAISALRALPPERRPVAVVNELTPDARAALADGVVTMVLGTPLRPLSRELVRLMADAVQGQPVPAETFLPFEIHVPESL